MDLALKITGRLDIFIDGKLVSSHSNLIVATGRDAMLQSFMGDATFVLTSFEAGDGTTAPAAGNTALQSSTFGPKALTTVAFPTLGSVKLTFDIIPGEATGQTFTEWGLFTTAGTLIARVVDGNSYVKTLTNSIQGQWTLTLS